MTKILTVDDSRAVRTIIAKTLKSKFEIVEAEDGEKGLEKLASEPDVDLVLLDVTMPNMDGPEMLQHMRESGMQRQGAAAPAAPSGQRGGVDEAATATFWHPAATRS